MAIGRTIFSSAFWAVVALDAFGSLILIFTSEGTQDAAGRGMQAGYGIVLLAIIAAMVALWWSVRSLFVRIPVFIMLVALGLLIATFMG